MKHDIYLKHYIDCIADAGRQLNSREWWATHIASKNRFTSRLAQKLESESTPKALGSSEKAQFGPWRKLLQALRIVSAACKTILHHAQARICLADKTTKLRRSSGRDWYVIKTFVYDHSFTADGEYRDVFFGRLPQILKSHGCNVLVYATILGNRKNCLHRMEKCRDIDIIPIELFLDTRSVISDMFNLLFMRFRPLDTVMFDDKNVAPIINAELSDTLNNIPAYQYFHYRFIESLSRFMDIETFLQTGENNPWERMCIMALRKYSPATRILSYQHAVVPQASANMFAGRGEAELAPLPDHLLTTGPEPKRIIEQFGDYPSGFVVSACGLRYEYLDNIIMNPVKETRPRRILLALEGIPEVVRMVEYAVRELADNHDYSITVRAHPSLPFETLQKHLPSDLRGMDALEISQNRSLMDDIERADAVMYWGTTVALEALKAGKRVIHFDMETRLSYDPLFLVESMKRSVTSKDSLSEVLDALFICDPDALQKEQQSALNYLNDYFAPVCFENIKPFLPRSLKTI